jgi:hypothetical protein
LGEAVGKIREGAIGDVIMVKAQRHLGAKTMALDPKTHNLFVDTSDFISPGAAPSKLPNPPRKAKPGTFRLLFMGVEDLGALRRRHAASGVI